MKRILFIILIAVAAAACQPTRQIPMPIITPGSPAQECRLLCEEDPLTARQRKELYFLVNCQEPEFRENHPRRCRRFS